MRKTYSYIIFVLFFISFNLRCQNYLLHGYEDSLKTLCKSMFNGENFAVKNAANKKFINIFNRALNEQNSFNYSFDSLINISRIVSPENNFRIFTWAILDDKGIYKSYGYIQICSDKKKTNKIIYLNDKRDSIEKPENLILTGKNWYGAIYYKIIPNKYKKNRYYTLLGWQGNNMISRKKIIDVLTFDSNYIPSFGASVFKTQRTEPKRIIFEYSAQAVMSLRYEQQYYNKTKGKSIYAYDKINNIDNNKDRKSANNKMKKKKAYMIVFDRLVAMSPGLENQFQYYVPSSDFLDGFLFRKGKWRLIYDIDARNAKKVMDDKTDIQTAKQKYLSK